MDDRPSLALAAALTAGFALVLAAFGAMRIWVFDADPRDLVYEGLFVLALMAVGFLRAALPALGRAIDTGLAYYFTFTLVYFATFMPGIGYFALAKWIIALDWPAVQATFFAVSGLVWLGFVAVLFPSATQTRLLSALAGLGWLTPFVFLVNYMIISLVFFGFLAFYFFGAGPEGSADSDTYLNLFGYHLLDSIPALKIPATLRLEQPMPGARPFALGLMILVFKFAVLIPGIGAFRAYWKTRAG